MEDALDDLNALEMLHEDSIIGKFDSAVIDQENGQPHIAKRMDRPRIRVIPEEFGSGALSRKMSWQMRLTENVQASPAQARTMTAQVV